MFIPIMCLVSLTLAEPPVGDGYAAVRLSHDNHHHDTSDHQRYLPQKYGPPSETFESTRNGPSDGYEYNAPNARNSPNTRSQTQKHTPATVHISFNQRFSSSPAKSSAQDHTASGARSHSQEHVAPNARNGISQEYGPPAARSQSQKNGVPSIVTARTLSTEYGMPDAKSTPSQDYGVPVVAARNQKPQPASNFRSVQPTRSFSQDYSMPAARSYFQTDSTSHSFVAPSARSNNVAQGYEAPEAFAQSAPTSRNAPTPTFSAPNSRTEIAVHGVTGRIGGSQDFDSISQTYGAPSQRDLSERHSIPSARGLSQEYGAPSSYGNQITSAESSSYKPASSRSSPSSTYLPATRNAAPSEQYGVPEQRDADSLAKARALEELKNQEPASYDFSYQIEHQESGSDFGHTETREEGRAQGSYFVVRPDGTKQTVEYEADERGFRPRISVEPAAGGYDENAADIARSAEGPY